MSETTPTRPLLAHATPHVRAKQAGFHAELVRQLQDAVATHDVVVMGMSVNPNVPRARKALDAAGIAHHDIDHGGYLSGWKARLAVKMWAGWPTFPMVFVKGALIGGADSTVKMLESGELQQLLSQDRPA